MSDSSRSVPAKALFLVLGGLIISGLLAFFLIYPVWSDIGRSEARLRDLQAQVQVKEVLMPTYQILHAAMGRLPEPGPFPLPGRVPLGLDMDKLSVKLIRDAEEHGLTTLNVSPAVDALAGTPDRILVAMNLRGPLDAFQAYLLHLLRQTYLDQVRALTVREAGANREYALEFTLHYR